MFLSDHNTDSFITMEGVNVDDDLLTQYNFNSDLFQTTTDIPTTIEDFFVAVPDIAAPDKTLPTEDITGTTDLPLVDIPLVDIPLVDNTPPIAEITVDNTRDTARPKRAANVRALENIRAILEWEHCSKGSSLFKSIETHMNGEFDSLNKKRSFANISNASVDETHNVDDQNYVSEAYDTDQNVSDNTSSDDDDDDYSIDSFVVSDSAELEYDATSDDHEGLSDDDADDVHDDAEDAEDVDSEDTEDLDAEDAEVLNTEDTNSAEETSSVSSTCSTHCAEN